MKSHIGWGGEWNTLYKGVETSPEHTCFKALRGSLKGKAQRGQYLLVMGLGGYINTCLFTEKLRGMAFFSVLSLVSYLCDAFWLESNAISLSFQVLTDSETVRWLNHVVEKIWPICMEHIVSQKILLPIIPWFLEKYKPWTAVWS